MVGLKRKHTPDQWRAKLASANAQKRKKKAEAIAYKGGKCARCHGVFHQAVYDFHHLDPTLKEERSAIFLNRGWDRIKPELDKCILLCANCHRIVHYDYTKEDTMNTETTTAFAPVPALRELTAEEWALLAAKLETEESFVTTDEETEATEETPTLH